MSLQFRVSVHGRAYQALQELAELAEPSEVLKYLTITALRPPTTLDVCPSMDDMLSAGRDFYQLRDMRLTGRVITVTIKDAFLDELAANATARGMTIPTLIRYLALGFIETSVILPYFLDYGRRMDLRNDGRGASAAIPGVERPMPQARIDQRKRARKRKGHGLW